MKRFRCMTAWVAAALFATALAAPRASADGVAGEPDAPFLVAAGDCYAIGEQVAQQNGGTLAKASQSAQNGQPVCVIVVLVPGKNGQRPRRTEVVVPLN